MTWYTRSAPTCAVGALMESATRSRPTVLADRVRFAAYAHALVSVALLLWGGLAPGAVQWRAFAAYRFLHPLLPLAALHAAQRGTGPAARLALLLWVVGLALALAGLDGFYAVYHMAVRRGLDASEYAVTFVLVLLHAAVAVGLALAAGRLRRVAPAAPTPSPAEYVPAACGREASDSSHSAVEYVVTRRLENGEETLHTIRFA